MKTLDILKQKMTLEDVRAEIENLGNQLKLLSEEFNDTIISVSSNVEESRFVDALISIEDTNKLLDPMISKMSSLEVLLRNYLRAVSTADQPDQPASLLTPEDLEEEREKMLAEVEKFNK